MLPARLSGSARDPRRAGRLTLGDVTAQDAIREGRHELAAQLRERVLTEEIEGELCVVAIPGTRDVLEIADGYLRVL